MTADDHVAGIVRASAIYRAADAVLGRLGAAWPASAARRALSPAAAGRLRFWAAVTVTAAATALIAGPMGTTPRPLAWVVPACAGAVGLVILALAARGADVGTRGATRP